MKFRRAKVEETHLFENKASVLRRTAFLAEDELRVYGIFEYRINDFEEAEITFFKMLYKTDIKVLFEGFITRISYWNPYLKKLKVTFDLEDVSEDLIKTIQYPYEAPHLIIDQNIKIFKIELSDIVPEQLTVDAEKYEVANSWILKPEDIIITCVKIDNQTVCIDGYSRLITAFRRGYPFVYAHYDKSFNKEFIKVCLKWCEEGHIETIADLSNRVVSPEEHQSVWIDKCQAYFNGGSSV